MYRGNKNDSPLRVLSTWYRSAFDSVLSEHMLTVLSPEDPCRTRMQPVCYRATGKPMDGAGAKEESPGTGQSEGRKKGSLLIHRDTRSRSTSRSIEYECRSKMKREIVKKRWRTEQQRKGCKSRQKGWVLCGIRIELDRRRVKARIEQNNSVTCYMLKHRFQADESVPLLRGYQKNTDDATPDRMIYRFV